MISESANSGKLVQQDDGTVRLYSEKDKGSTEGNSTYAISSHVDFHLTNVDVWISKKVVGAIIVVTAASVAAVVSYYFPALPVILASTIGTTLLGYFVNDLARPVYIRVSYFGNVQAFKTY